jgi:hypothetical protein
VYLTDRGSGELGERQGEEKVNAGLAGSAPGGFVDLHPEFDVPVGRLAAWLARADDEGDEL